MLPDQIFQGDMLIQQKNPTNYMKIDYVSRTKAEKCFVGILLACFLAEALLMLLTNESLAKLVPDS